VSLKNKRLFLSKSNLFLKTRLRNIKNEKNLFKMRFKNRNKNILVMFEKDLISLITKSNNFKSKMNF